MKIKKFEAASMKEALEKIKEEMGADAFILNTKQITKKGPLGFGDKRFLQVTAAIEEDGDGADAAAKEMAALEAQEKAAQADDKDAAWSAALEEQPAILPTYNSGGQAAGTSTGAATDTGGAGGYSGGFEAVFEAARQAPKEPLPTGKSKRDEDEREGGGRPLRQEINEIKSLVRDLGGQSATDLSPLQRELAELKTLLYNVIRSQTPFAGKSLTPVLFNHYQRLKDSGMDEAIAAKLIQIVDDKLPQADKENDPKVTRILLGMIKQSIDVMPPPKYGDGQTHVAALIGPTGVGKTTTIAKLAAHAGVKSGADVVLITLDTYRIAAVEQLKTYAKIMEIPIHVALNVNELKQAIQFHHDKSLILIDTAGHSQRDETGMNNIRQFLDGQTHIHTHLVLSATTKSADLNDIVQRFSVLNPDSLIFTKVDETSSYGPLFTQIVKTKKPVSFITTGQSVPEDFEVASKELLAGLFLGKSTVKGAAQ